MFACGAEVPLQATGDKFNTGLADGFSSLPVLMFWLVLLFWLPLVLSRLVNVTIDDTYGDARTGAVPLYDAPGNQWIARRPGDCSSCGAQPDGPRVHNGTWHDKTTFVDENPATITLSFNGTKVWIYCILANNIHFTDTRLSIEVDGIASSAASFLHTADTSSYGYIYDKMVYASETLDAGVHTVVVTNHASSLAEYGDTRYIGSIILFDYAIYTTEDPDESTSAFAPAPESTTHSSSSSPSVVPPSSAHPSSVNIGAIIGGTVGSVAVVLLCFSIALWWLIKWRRLRLIPAPSEPETPGRDRGEHEGFIAAYRSYTQQTTPSSYSATFSSPPASAGLPVDDRVDHRRSVRKSRIVIDADREHGHTHSVQELRDEMGNMRSELEMLKTTSAPPQYAG